MGRPQMGTVPNGERRLERLDHFASEFPNFMARQSRVVVPGVVHHVVARGVNKASIFCNGFDKVRYLKRAAKLADEEKVQIHGYCLMGNHVHFLLTPATPTGLADFFSRLHTWWAMFFNRKQNRTGHLFQSRYFSSPLSEGHYWTALRYVELNAVRARLVKRPEDWLWSSARDHLSIARRPLILLTPIVTRAGNTPADWREILQTSCDHDDEQLRRAHRSSQPCGPASFVKELEQRFARRLVRRVLPPSSRQLSAIHV